MTILIDKSKLKYYEAIRIKILSIYFVVSGIILVLLIGLFIISNREIKSIILLINILLSILYVFLSIYFLKCFYPNLKQLIRFLYKVNNDEHDINDIILIKHIDNKIKDNMDSYSLIASSQYKKTNIEKVFYTLDKPLPIVKNTKLRIWHINHIITAYEVLHEAVE